MKFTSCEINKQIKALTDRVHTLLLKENQTSTFIAATSENIEDVRPELDLGETERQINELQKEIRKFKHILNVFNSTTKVPGFDMTIDELLIALPQWNATLLRYAGMKEKLPKTRRNALGANSNNIEYIYTNYNIEEVAEKYAELFDLITRAQLALDNVNITQLIDIPE